MNTNSYSVSAQNYNFREEISFDRILYVSCDYF
ncbi:Uncharacterised protein [Streptococcus merionis]|uniref:Uncharacterized protein n=1 Tax=Streptococcus merionis TaxID=400065 RepID=A0A239SN44_9STRE|nr:Uncharacterised protein [Streptococcus merionis]